MKIYLVGGAVRDQLMGKEPKDRDYLILDSSSAELEAAGFLKVGNDFSVFLHPSTKEEYVLLRGQDLLEDLFRRDLTINAMAMDELGELIDPYGGEQDINQRNLRHVSSAFADDPLRVFRVARFCAQLVGFTVARETLELMEQIVKSQGFQNLSQERFFREIRLALEAQAPELFFDALLEVGASNLYASELQENYSIRREHLMKMTQKDQRPEFRLAAMLMEMDENKVQSLLDRWRVPNSWRELVLAANHYSEIFLSFKQRPSDELLEVFYSIDAFRKPSILEAVLSIMEVIYPEKELILRFVSSALDQVKEIGISDVSSKLEAKEIGEAIRKQRLIRLNEWRAS